MSLITEEKDKEFLKAQREDGRRGAMIGRDMILTNMESRRHKREEQEKHRAKKSRQDVLKMEAKAELSSSSSSSSSPMRPQDEGASTSTSDMPPSKRKRGSKKILNRQLVAAMDRTSTTDREAVHLLTAAAQCLGCNPDEYAMNRESFRGDRKKSVLRLLVKLSIPSNLQFHSLFIGTEKSCQTQMEVQPLTVFQY